MAICSLLGGIDPIALTWAFAIIGAVALLGCAAALCLSIWAKKPHEVILAIYTFWALVLLAYPVWLGWSRGGRISAPPHWVLLADPFYLAFSPYVEPGRTGAWAYAGFFAAALGTTAALILLSIRRMRPVTVRESSRGERIPRLAVMGRVVRMLPRPSLDRNPILWREWHRSRPSPWMAALVGFVAGTTTIACVIGACTLWFEGVGPGPGKYMGAYAYLLQMLFGFLMLAAVAPMSLSEERRRGSLDVVLATPLSTRTIVWEKWLGTYRLVPLLAICPGLVALVMATGPEGSSLVVWRLPGEGLTLDERLFGAALMVVTILAHGAAVTSLGLALATWTKRQSRAIALSVGAFVLLAIAWPILVMVLFLNPRDGGETLAVMSPLFMAGGLADALVLRIPRMRSILWSGAVWDLVVSLAAAGLLTWTIRTFDRCLGRMPEGDGSIGPSPKKSEPVFDEALDAV
jgi:ABC-type transport system involved in multi-copper enzyme maturation permease subunit